MISSGGLRGATADTGLLIDANSGHPNSAGGAGGSAGRRQMKAVTIHAARDLRIDEAPLGELGEKQVEIGVSVGGICGSDLHYYLHGGFGTVRLREPMILGHEVAGVVETVGAGVTRVKAGDLVAVNPSQPCRSCEYCQAGLQNHCSDMRFYGSAMRFPHVQGAFSERLIVDEDRCFVVPGGVSANTAALAEPFAVALNAVERAGSLLGKRLLVTGSGPIGALVAIAARLHGAREIVATDVVDATLRRMSAVGVDATINVARDPDALRRHAAGKGTFDVMFEASGNGSAISEGIATLRPRGALIQIGIGGEMNLPLNAITSREIDIRGSFRFNDSAFELAVALIGSGRADLSPLVTHSFGIDDAVEAFDTASNRDIAMKVQLVFQNAVTR